MTTRYITVPLTSAAERRLDRNEASPDELKECLLEDQEFWILWNSGIFERINQECNTLIDSFEDDKLATSGQQKKAEQIVLEWLSSADEALGQLLEEFLKLLRAAQSLNTGIYFYL